MKEKKITGKLDYYIDFVQKEDKTDKTIWHDFPITTNKKDCYQMNEKGKIRYYNNGWYCYVPIKKNENGLSLIDILNDNMEWIEVDVLKIYLQIFGQFPLRKTMQHINIAEVTSKVPLGLQKQTYDDILIINNISPKEQKVVSVSITMNLIQTNFKPYISNYNESEQIYICERFFNLCMKKLKELLNTYKYIDCSFKNLILGFGEDI